MPQIPTAHFTTDLLPQADRYEAWRQMLAASHEVISTELDFSGAVRSTRLEGMVVHVMRASPQATVRDWRRVRRDGLEHLVLHVNAAPALGLVGDAEVRIPSYGISINDLSQPSQRSAVPEMDSVIISLSRELVTEARGFSQGLHGTIIEHGAGALLGAHLRSLALHAADIEDKASAPVARGTAQLLVACLDPTRHNLEQARLVVETAVLTRARRHIDAHLGNATLAPDKIARGIGVSRSTLFRLFEPFGGVSRYVTERRLRAARRLLADLRNRQRISEVAKQFGFASDARFSREFKRSFGIAPKDYAHADPAGNAELTHSPTRRETSFSAWVRDLG